MQESDVEQVMARIRESIRQRRSAEPASRVATPPSSAPNGDGTPDGLWNDGLYDFRNIQFTSHRALLGPAIVGIKTILRKLLTPILERQAAFNAASARAIDGLQRQVHQETGALRELMTAQAQLIETLESQVQERIAALESRHARDLDQGNAELQRQLDRHSMALHGLREAHEAGRLRLARAERKLRRILHALEPDEAGGGPVPAARDERRVLAPRPSESEFDYAGFEEEFRGSEEDIKERQRIYLDHFDGRDTVLDIGCGRGEFLELLRERGVKARGIDTDLDMVLLCRDKGLDAIHADAFAHLTALPDESLGGVFAAQIIEHLPPARIVELVRLCHRKLAPGAPLVVETPNPKCLMVFADSFYRDLTHVQPIHPDTAKFLLEAAGFRAVEVRFLAPVDAAMHIPRIETADGAADSFNQAIDRLNTLLFGPQDYAVIGQKGWSSADDNPSAQAPDA